MKALLFGVLLLCLTGSYAGAVGNITNRDNKAHNLYFRFYNGWVKRVIIQGNSVLLNPCVGPCVVTVVDTGDSAHITPDDDVEISYGRIHVRSKTIFPRNVFGR